MRPPTTRKTESFPYRAHLGKMLFVAIFCGSGAAFFGHEAAANDRGVFTRGVVEYGQTGATIFHAVLGTLCALGLLAAIAATVHRWVSKPVLVLAPGYIDIPRGLIFKRRVERIEFRNVRSVSFAGVSGERYFVLHTAEGKVSVVRSLLASDAVFWQIVMAVYERMPRHRRWR